MRQYILRRLVYVPLIMAIVSVLAFFTLRMPWAIDPVTLYVNQNTTLEQEQQIRRELGLDKPAVQQFFLWLGEVARGDLGLTFRSRQPVWEEIVRRLPVNLEILALSVLFSTLFGVTFGVITAVKQNTTVDYASSPSSDSPSPTSSSWSSSSSSPPSGGTTHRPSAATSPSPATPSKTSASTSHPPSSSASVALPA